MDDLNFQKLSTVQNEQMPTPVTLAAAATLAPTTFLTVVTGTTAVDNITPPVSGVHMLAFVFTDANPGGFSASGNVVAAVDPAQNGVVLAIYNPVTAHYSAGKLALG